MTEAASSTSRRRGASSSRSTPVDPIRAVLLPLEGARARRFSSRRWPRAWRPSSRSRIRPSPSTASPGTPWTRSSPERRPRSTAAYFDVWILKLSGLFPSPRECAGCGRRSRGRRAAALRRAPSRLRRARSAAQGEARCGRRREAHRTLAGFLSAPLDPAARPPGLARDRRASRGSRAGTSWATSSRASACWPRFWADGHWTGCSRGRSARLRPTPTSRLTASHAVSCSQCSPCSGSSRS